MTVMMYDEVESIWKEVVLAYSRYCPRICQERLGKIIKAWVRTAGIPAKIRTQHFPNTSLESYC
jgi:hypothetical protein